MKMFGNFLNNIRSLQIKANKLKNHNVKLICRAKDDLVLAKKFIKRASNGISMNMLTFRRPTKVYVVDSCEHSLGGQAFMGEIRVMSSKKN